MQYSFRFSNLRLSWHAIAVRRRLTSHGRMSHHRYEQIRDARPAHVTHRRELATIDTIEQHHASAEHLAFVDRFERPSAVEVIWMYHQLHIARVELLHAALKHDSSVIDEHEI